MNIFFRILLAIYAFCLSIISILAAICAIRPKVFKNISDSMNTDMLTSNNARIIMFIVSLVFFILSLVFLFSGVRSDKDKKSVSKYTNIGEIRISLNSIESIALTASKRLNGVRETKAYITKCDDGVSITIKAVILGDINIPSISEDIQVKVKGLIEESTGIKVNDVKVLVENVYTGFKSRVE